MIRAQCLVTMNWGYVQILDEKLLYRGAKYFIDPGSEFKESFNQDKLWILLSGKVELDQQLTTRTTKKSFLQQFNQKMHPKGFPIHIRNVNNDKPAILISISLLPKF